MLRVVQQRQSGTAEAEWYSRGKVVQQSGTAPRRLDERVQAELNPKTYTFTPNPKLQTLVSTKDVLVRPELNPLTLNPNP